MAKKVVAVLGSSGLVGRACEQAFVKAGYIVFAPPRDAIDLTDREALRVFAEGVRPNWVIVAAGKVGGIGANTACPADFGYVNAMIASHCLDQFRNSRLVYLGSGCMYPRDCPQPMKPEHLGTGPMEPSSEVYALAKLLGVRMADAYRRQYNCDYMTVIPAALYGPNDSFHPRDCHVVPALVRKYLETPHDGLVKLMGTGNPVRDFLHVSDLVRAIELVLLEYDGAEPVNVGSGKGHTIRELAETVSAATGFGGVTAWDATKPDGQPQKLLDSSVITKMGWEPRIKLADGLDDLVRWVKANPWCFERRYEEFPDLLYCV